MEDRNAANLSDGGNSFRLADGLVDSFVETEATICSRMAQLSAGSLAGSSVASCTRIPNNDELAHNSSISHTETTQVHQHLPLDKLPLDVILKIGSFLAPKDIIGGLMGACKAMEDIFGDEEYWRVRIKNQWHVETYPILADKPPLDTSRWKKRCHYREEQYFNFKFGKEKMASRVIGVDQGALHYADINAMAFGPKGDYLATAGRDRQVIVWRLEELKKMSEESPEIAVAKAQSLLFSHGGWVWSLQTLDNYLSSSSWDGVINIADLNHPVKPKYQTLKWKHALTCHSWDPHGLVAGTIHGAVVGFDPRKDEKPIFQKKQEHSEAVLGMQIVDHQVIFVGSERKIQVFDLRKRDFVVKRSIPNNDFGTKIHVNEGHAWVGTKHGKVLLYDLCNFDVVEDLSAGCGHTDHITGLHYDSGHILTCSLDRKARMVEPVRSPGLIWEHTSDSGYTSMDYGKNCTLALAWGPVFGLWWPKDT